MSGSRTRYFVEYRDDVRIDTVAEGQGDLIVVLPSANRASTDMDDFATLLAGQGFRVLRPQPRGMERTSAPLEGMTLRDLADDVAAVIEHEGAGPAIVLGHAYGNWIARMVAAAHPGAVRGVVLAAASCLAPPNWVVDCFRILVSPQATHDDRRDALRRAFFAPGHDPEIMVEGFHPALIGFYDAANRAIPKQVWWPAGSAPILDLQGALDPWRPADTRNEIRDALGDRVTIEVIAGLSHALMLEEPEPVAQAIRQWADDLDA
ncbi:alpha/beta fold hydrolase [Cucumibacter marinus]|uniref:alpha/beta fold hydrolase n=1 Tax=Cucumibacter marinus TaxID=1121252 RepID=UPI00041A47F9|nr:alpha/beta hydrolase [Cucumibacter marinus]